MEPKALSLLCERSLLFSRGRFALLGSDSGLSCHPMTVYRDSAGNLIESPDTTTVYLSSTNTPMDGLPSTPGPYLNAAGQLMGGDPNFPRGGEWVLENDAWDDNGVWLIGKSWL